MLSVILFSKFCENIFLLISPKDKNLNRNESFINPFVLFSQLFGAVSGEVSCINNVSGPIQQTLRVCKMTCKFCGACNSDIDLQFFFDFIVVEVKRQTVPKVKGSNPQMARLISFLYIPEQVPNLT